MIETETLSPDLLTKGEFAALIGVSPSRISQMIAEGKIAGEALRGEGRDARIIASIAKRQIDARTDVGQRFGNGIGTRLEPDAPAPDSPGTEDRATGDSVNESIKAEKLLALQYANRRRAEDERFRAGLYVRSDEASAAMAKMASQLMNVFEGAMTELAQAIASEFEIPGRDVLHRLRREYVVVRERAAAAALQHVEALPVEVVDTFPDAGDPALGEA